jgi:hypothetical protein
MKWALAGLLAAGGTLPARAEDLRALPANTWAPLKIATRIRGG